MRNWRAQGRSGGLAVVPSVGAVSVDWPASGEATPGGRRGQSQNSVLVQADLRLAVHPGERLRVGLKGEAASVMACPRIRPQV